MIAAVTTGHKKSKQAMSKHSYVNVHPREGGTPIYFLYRDVPTVRVSFSGSSVLNRVYNFPFCVLNRVVPVNLVLSSPFDHIIFADFVYLRWNA